MCRELKLHNALVDAERQMESVKHEHQALEAVRNDIDTSKNELTNAAAHITAR